MDNAVHILVADYVPLSNKGEEAIVRGIEDMLSGGRTVALGLFDNVADVVQRGNITVFPREWLLRFEGRSGLSARTRVLLQVMIAMQLRLGLYGRLQNVTPAGDKRCRALQEFFRRADYVLVGHDGVFGVESCGIIHLAKQHGKRTGILGASTGINGGRLYKTWLYRRTLEESDFCVFREHYSRESMKAVCRDPGKLIVGPDPAFAMRPAEPEDARKILDTYDRYRCAIEQNRPVVAVTVLEKGRVYAGFRPDLNGREKQRAHARYLAGILDALVRQQRAFVLFLPHSIEEVGNDVIAAGHVAEQMRSGPDDMLILERDCDARTLKGIIAHCDFLVGQRTHSLIAGVSVGTPFVALTNRKDTRTHGIIGDMCRCEDRIVDMDVTSEEEASHKVLGHFGGRAEARAFLESVRRELSRKVEGISRLVRWNCGRAR